MKQAHRVDSEDQFRLPTQGLFHITVCFWLAVPVGYVIKPFTSIIE